MPRIVDDWRQLFRGSGIVWLVSLIASAIWAAALIHRGVALEQDEIEFFRATRWIAEGRVPFRDFWEHHLPLQWLLFAPAAHWWGGGAGTTSVVALRWAQVPFWLAIFGLVCAIARRAGVGQWGRLGALACLLASPWFVRVALQYRVDVPGHLGYFAALFLIVAGRSRAWPRFFSGALFALAVLANMRLAPLVIVTTLLAFFWCVDEQRWSFDPRALWIVAGGMVVSAGFVFFLESSRTTSAFIDGVLWYNTTSDSLVPSEARSFWIRILSPFRDRDIAGSVFITAAVLGIFTSLRDLRRPGVSQITALLAVVSLSAIAVTKVQYPYHFHAAILLMVPQVGRTAERLHSRWRVVAMATIGFALALDLAMLASPVFGRAMDYQDRVMVEADRWTRATDRVWDGCGTALRREPAYKYWFLPAGVRLMSDAGLIEPYDLEQMAAKPPALIVSGLRTRAWLAGRPRLLSYATHHYLPLYQHLWIPGMSGLLEDGASVSWRVPKTGRYDLRVSEVLARHPWFTHPLGYGVMEGSDLEIPLDRLDVVPLERFECQVNGVTVTPVGGVLDLPAGARLVLSSSFPRRVGVVFVPSGIKTLGIMPDAPVAF